MGHPQQMCSECYKGINMKIYVRKMFFQIVLLAVNCIVPMICGGESFAIVIGKEECADEFKRSIIVPSNPLEIDEFNKGCQIAALRLSKAIALYRKQQVSSMVVTNDDIQRDIDEVMKSLERKHGQNYQHYKQLVETRNATIALIGNDVTDAELMSNPQLTELFPEEKKRREFITIVRKKKLTLAPLKSYEQFLENVRAEFVKIPNYRRIQQNLLNSLMATQSPWGAAADRARLRKEIRELPTWRVKIVYTPTAGEKALSVTCWLEPLRMIARDNWCENFVLLTLLKHVDRKGEFTEISIPGTTVSIIYDGAKRESDSNQSVENELSESDILQIIANFQLTEQFLENKPYFCTIPVYDNFIKDGGWLFAYVIDRFPRCQSSAQVGSQLNKGMKRELPVILLPK